MSKFLEKWFLDKYYFLIRRIPGLSMSLTDFWDTPSQHVNQIYRNEMEVLKKEKEEYDKMNKKHGTTRPDHKDDSEVMVDLYEELYEE